MKGKISKLASRQMAMAASALMISAALVVNWSLSPSTKSAEAAHECVPQAPPLPETEYDASFESDELDIEGLHYSYHVLDESTGDSVTLDFDLASPKCWTHFDEPPCDHGCAPDLTPRVTARIIHYYDLTLPVICNNLLRAVNGTVSGDEPINIAAAQMVLDTSCQPTMRVSIGPNGEQGNDGSSLGSVSLLGKFIAFTSYAFNFPGAVFPWSQVYVRDREGATTELISINAEGSGGGNASSYGSAISGDGRYVAFSSQASNLVTPPTNNLGSVYRRDRQGPSTVLVSTSATGERANKEAAGPCMSLDGGVIGFGSKASNLVPGLPPLISSQIFVKDMATGIVKLASANIAGGPATGDSWFCSLSADGRFVAFESAANDLVPGDSNGQKDVFVRDLQSGTTARVSIGTSGAEANGPSVRASISGDGGYVVFTSAASNLTSILDLNAANDLFLRDISAGTTTLLSVSRSGAPATVAGAAQISLNGQHVAFASNGADLVDGDLNGKRDIFIRDLVAEKTWLISVDSNGVQALDESLSWPAISPDGAFVAFDSRALNLVLGKTTGHLDVFLRQAFYKPLAL